MMLLMLHKKRETFFFLPFIFLLILHFIFSRFRATKKVSLMIGTGERARACCRVSTWARGLKMLSLHSCGCAPRPAWDMKRPQSAGEICHRQNRRTRIIVFVACIILCWTGSRLLIVMQFPTINNLNGTTDVFIKRVKMKRRFNHRSDSHTDRYVCVCMHRPSRKGSINCSRPRLTHEKNKRRIAKKRQTLNSHFCACDINRGLSLPSLEHLLVGNVNVFFSFYDL